MTVIDSDMSLGFSDIKRNIFLKWIGSDKRILDLGCYDGRDSELFLKSGNDVYGVEILEKPAKEAESRGIRVSVFDMDKLEFWPFESEFFDIIVCGDVIEHVINVDSFLSNIRRMLKSNGLVLISTPNIASIGRRLMLLFGKNPYIEISQKIEVNGFPSVGHVRYFTVEILSKLLKYNGFVVEEITTDYLNLGIFKSALLGKLFPRLSWRIIALARKGEND